MQPVKIQRPDPPRKHIIKDIQEFAEHIASCKIQLLENDKIQFYTQTPQDQYFNMNFDKSTVSPENKQKAKNPFLRNSLTKEKQEIIQVYRDSLETEQRILTEGSMPEMVLNSEYRDQPYSRNYNQAS